MKPTLLITVASCAFQLAAMPPAQANASDRSGVNKHTGLYELPLSDLRKAAERGDRAELGRTAARMGPGRIAKALADSDRRVVLAALEALPLFDGGVLLLGSTVPLLAATDPGVRAQAARSVDLLLSANDTGSLDAWEITEETVQAVCRALGRLAADDKEETGTRVLAVQGILDAGENCATSAPLARLQTAVAPEIRRAAVLALPIDPNVVPNGLPKGAPTSAKILATAAADRDGRVAAAAGAQWCKLQLRQGAGKPMEAPALSPPLRTLVRSERALPEDVMDMLPCLVASSDAEDKRAVDDLRAKGSSAIREALKQTGTSGKAAKP